MESKMVSSELNKRIWTGSWIEPDQEPAFKEPQLSFEEMAAAEGAGLPGECHLKNTRHLRRSLDLRNENGEMPVKVTAFASAHGVYDLYINGQKADERLLAPETSNCGLLIWYQKYDITEHAVNSSKKTEMLIDVLLGDGWWIGRLGMAGSSCNYGDKLGFIMDVELVYPDGSKRTEGTDERYMSCDSFIRYSDLYIGEMQDGCAFDADDIAGDIGDGKLNGYSAYVPEFKTCWKKCRKASYPTDILAEQIIPGIRVIRRIPMVQFIHNPNGDLIADFGQVMAGTVSITVDTKRGSVITVEHSEVLDKEGNFFINIKGLYKDQRDRYIADEGMQTFTPHFTYHGFRYIRITGIERSDIKDVTALVYGTPLEKIGYFETDNDLINRFQNAIEASTISNMISVPTDCPQREKLGWTGDISVFTETGAFLYDLRLFLKSWLLQVRLDQTDEGEIPVVVPNHPCQDSMQRAMSGGTNSSAAWSDCCIFIPLKLYKIYGDISFLEDNYEMMEKWMSYVEKQADGYLWTGRFHFGDWLIPSLREKPDGIMLGVRDTADIVGSCYYSIAADRMAEVCMILGKNDRAAYYRELKDHIDDAIVKAYVSSDGKVGNAMLQGLYVIMLKTGAVRNMTVRYRMISLLAGMIKENGYSLDCGFASVPFLLDVLYDNGYKEEAYRMLFCTKAPSWLYMIQNGATSIWENWCAVKEDGTVTDSSYNHYAYGCVGDFMYRHIGGIEATSPGFSSIKIAPDLNCGIKSSCCVHKVPGGEIKVNWKLTDAENIKGSIHIEIPEGVTADLLLKGNPASLTKGKYDFDF